MLSKRVFLSILILTVLSLKAASFEQHPHWDEAIFTANLGVLDHDATTSHRAHFLGLYKPHRDVDIAARNAVKFYELPASVSHALPLHTMAISASASKTTTLVELANLRSYPTSMIYDQGNEGSCTANSAAFDIRYLTARNSTTPAIFDSSNRSVLAPSRNYHYYNTRYEEGVIIGDPTNVQGDNGASMFGSMLALDKYGTCPEAFSAAINLEHGFTYRGWPYLDTQYATQPDPESYRFALDSNYSGLYTDTRSNPYRVVSQNLRYADLTSKYHKSNPATLNTSTEIASVIADFRNALSRNTPIDIGIPVEQAFLNAPGGYVPMPALNGNFKPIGGHAISIVGHGPYKAGSTQNYFKFINSWGGTWGDHGYGYLPELYVAHINFFGIDAFAVDLLK
ncbi:MAG: C1 family peptidase [Pseudomonadota bacterium]|jgi:hypothetical protein|nr:C1 family peptidase [Alphaproteobacteria bacterium]